MLRDCMARESERGAKAHTSQELHMPFATRCNIIYFIALFILTSLSHPLREHTSLYLYMTVHQSRVRPPTSSPLAHSLSLSLFLLSFDVVSRFSMPFPYASPS